MITFSVLPTQAYQPNATTVVLLKVFFLLRSCLIDENIKVMYVTNSNIYA